MLAAQSTVHISPLEQITAALVWRLLPSQLDLPFLSKAGSFAMARINLHLPSPPHCEWFTHRLPAKPSQNVYGALPLGEFQAHSQAGQSAASVQCWAAQHGRMACAGRSRLHLATAKRGNCMSVLSKAGSLTPRVITCHWFLMLREAARFRQTRAWHVSFCASKSCHA